MLRLTDLKSSVERKLLKRIPAERVLPLQIDITNACNLSCRHCYHSHHKNEGALSFVQWQTVLDEYEALCTEMGFQRSLIVCGGEPLFSKLLVPVLEYVLSKPAPYRLHILTNGTLISDARLAVFRRFSTCFQVSLDGPDAVTHNLVRGMGCFEKSLEGIRLLKQAGFRVELLAVLSKNSSARIPEFFSLAKSLNCDAMGFTRLLAIGTGRKFVKEGSDRLLSPDELRAAYLSILQNSAKYGVLSNTLSPLMRLIDPALGITPRFAEALVVDYQGHLLASSRSSLRLGNVLDEGLENLFLHHPLKKALRRGQIKTCGKCDFYSACGGDRSAAYAATGDFLGEDPGCWIISKKKETPCSIQRSTA